MNTQTIHPLEERRAAPRSHQTCACKIFDPLSRKYIAAQTLDVSATGLLMTVDRPLELPPETEVFVGVASHPAQAVVRLKDMKHARIIRLLRGPGRSTTLALEYVEDVLPQTANMRLAA